MNRGFGLLLAIPIYFLAIVTLYMVDTVKQEDQQLEEYILTFAVDYATEAAVGEMLNSAHLGQDYADLGRTNLDPNVALETFINIFRLSYDLPLTDRTKAQVESGYIPLFCVAAYDGYYVYEPYKRADGTWTMQGSQKYPYSYRVGDKYYALNLGGANAYLLEDGSLSKVTLESQGITPDESYQLATSLLSDDLMYRFQANTGRDGEFVFLPHKLTTLSRVSPINTPTVLAFIDGWDFTTTQSISAFSIGGAQIEQVRMVAAYVRVLEDGTTRKFYAYADLVPASERDNIVNMYTTVQEAALNGYYHDSLLMG